MASSQIRTGQLTLTSTAQQLSEVSEVTRDLTITAFTTNSGMCFWGGEGVTTADGDLLPPGAAIGIPVADPTTVWVVGTDDDVISWSAVAKP